MRNYLILFSILITFPIQAQTAQEIIAKHRKATGAELRSDIKSMYMSLTLENLGGGDIPMNMHILRPNKVSISMEFMGQKILMVQNGAEFWMVNPAQNPEPQALPVGQQGQLTQALDDLDGQFADYLGHPENYEYLGMENIEGVGHHKIKVLNNPKAEEAVVFFDETSFYPTRQELAVMGQKAVNEMSDFRVISGIHIPFLITTMLEGKVANRMIIKEVTINQPVDPTVFDKP